jgi:hypothetical protein
VCALFGSAADRREEAPHADLVAARPDDEPAVEAAEPRTTTVRRGTGQERGAPSVPNLESQTHRCAQFGHCKCTRRPCVDSR